MRRLMVAIEDGTWRSVLSGGAAGSMTVGNGRRLDQPGGACGRGGNRGPLGHQESIGGDGQGRMMMKAAPTAPLVVAEADLLFEFEIVALDQPAQLGEIDQPGDRGVGGQGGQPELGRLRLAFGPFDVLTTT